MTPDQWQRVEELFYAALELPISERKDFLIRASSGDEALRRRVEALLKSYDEGGDFLDKDVLHIAARAAMHTRGRAGSLLGATISHYKTISLCGAGGMGEVYLADDVRLGRRVALKILPPEIPLDQERMRRFMREARAASALNHPNVATIYDVGSSDGVHFIAMEYVEGQTLAEKIDSGPIDPALVIEIGRQVADALEAAHLKGITHRDVKPANLILTPRGQVKVLDFGLAKFAQLREETSSAVPNRSDTVSGIVMGTVNYMSPEQVQGKAVDHRTDIFSLGVVLYEMATGRLPFPGSTSGERPPSQLEPIILKCLEKNPDHRYQSAAELRVDLTNLQREDPALLNISDPIDTHIAPRETQSHPRFSRNLVVLLGVILIGVLVGVWWLNRRNLPTLAEQRVFRVSTFPGAHREASFSPDGKRIAFINDADGVPQVWVKTLAGGDPIQITHGKQPASGPRWSPAGDQILYALLSKPNTPQGYPAGDLWVVSSQGGAPQELITDGLNPSWSWDGTQLVFERGADLWMANADGTSQRRIENVPPMDYFLAHRRPALSPDGTIAFFQTEPAVPWGDLWVIPSKGGVPKRLTSDATWSGGLAWTPDGRFVVFSSERSGTMSLWKVPVAGGDPEPMPGTGEDTDPEISRDGRTVIYTNTRTTYSIVVTDPATGQSTDIYSSPTRKAAAYFSPRGDVIAFTEMTETGLQVFTIRLDGTNRTQVTRETETRNVIPQWSPDGSALYYYQIWPALSFRKIPAQGGQSVEIGRGWTWATHNGARVDPENKQVIYSTLDRNTASQTRIRDIESGKEKPFTRALLQPRWSSDGKFVAGRDSFGNITICPTDGGACRPLTMGWAPKWLQGDSRIYFDREGARTLLEVWSISRNGKDETKLADLTDFFGFVDYSPTGQILWIRTRSLSSELWSSTLPVH